jgi:hypothetical protein
MIHDIGALVGAHAHAGLEVAAKVALGRDQRGRRLEGLRDGHVARLHVAEVDLP